MSPNKLAAPCPVPGCPNLNCQTHKRGGAVPDSRESAAKRGYDRTWRKLRLMFLRANPLCAECGKAAEDVHHIIALEDGGTNEWGNLEARCHSCHSRLTAKSKTKD